MDTRIERIVLETGPPPDRRRSDLPREGYRSRLSDYLNHGEMVFIPLANAVISPIDGDPAPAERRDFIAVARAHVHLAYPAVDRAERRRAELSASGDPVAERDLAVGPQQDHALLVVERPDHQALGHERADLLRREVDDRDDQACPRARRARSW